VSRSDLTPNPRLPPLERELQHRLLKLIDEFGGIARDLSFLLSRPAPEVWKSWETSKEIWTEALTAAFTHEISEGNWRSEAGMAPQDEGRYFIYWRGEISGMTGRDSKSLPFSEASNCMQRLRLSAKGVPITYWLELDDEDEDEVSPPLTPEESRVLSLMHQLSDVSEAAGTIGETTLEDVLDTVTFMWEVGLIGSVEKALRPVKGLVREALDPTPPSALSFDDPGAPVKEPYPSPLSGPDRPMIQILIDPSGTRTKLVRRGWRGAASEIVEIPVMEEPEGTSWRDEGEFISHRPLPTFSARVYHLHRVIAADHWGPTEVEYR
jgi:hypothetical protein